MSRLFMVFFILSLSIVVVRYMDQEWKQSNVSEKFYEPQMLKIDINQIKETRNPAQIKEKWVIYSNKIQLIFYNKKNQKSNIIKKILNKTNGFTASIFNNKEMILTDYITLEQGENEIELILDENQGIKSKTLWVVFADY